MRPIKVHPVRAKVIILWGDDKNKLNELHKGRDCEGSLISFDRRQIWTVYPYKRYTGDPDYWGACEYRNMYIRLGPEDFKYIFGDDIVERVKLESENKDKEETK